MKGCAFGFLFAAFLLACSLHGQTRITISDSNGNQTFGTVSNGNVYFYDTNGKQTFGTIRNGQVFLNTSKGETVFGTVKNGRVFLTDDHGNTTGTIRDGQIFLSNSDGSITTGTYSVAGGGMTADTSTNGSSTRGTLTDRQQRQQQDYEAGYAFGQELGSAIGGAIQEHRINSFCKANPTSTYLNDDGTSIPCPNAPLSDYDKTEADAYCYDHPGSWIEFGKHRVDCVKAPDPPTLAWAKWEMDAWRWDYTHQKKSPLHMSSDALQAAWSRWQDIYCGIAGPTGKYKDLRGKKQSCN